jgi:hypothetical protein
VASSGIVRSGNHHPLAAQGPAPPALRVKPKTAFISHPDIDRLILGQGQFFQLLFQFGANGGVSRRNRSAKPPARNLFSQRAKVLGEQPTMRPMSRYPC